MYLRLNAYLVDKGPEYKALRNLFRERVKKSQNTSPDVWKTRCYASYSSRHCGEEPYNDFEERQTPRRWERRRK